MIEIVNRQRKIRLDVNFWHDYADIVCRTAGITGKFLTVAFVSDRRMRALNKNFRGKNLTTDVLSFSFEPDEFDADENNLGDIVISAEQAARQAAENELDLRDKLSISE